MQFKLYELKSADNVINKTIIDPLTMEINLRRGVDIVAPVLRIEYVSDNSLNKYNYCHISDLGRFYFIRDIQSITRNVWELHLECDVLETYKAEILASNAKFRKVIESGDYGETNLALTGEVVVSDHMSDVVLESADNSLLSILRWN